MCCFGDIDKGDELFVGISSVDFQQGHSNGSTKEFKHNGYRSWGGKSKGVEKVQQENVGDHHSNKNDHDFGKDKHFGVKDAFACNLHQTTGENGTSSYTYTGHNHNHAKA